jgi:hypothetical protein
MKRTLLSLCLALAGCTTSAGGPEYVDFGISASENAGDSYPQVCTPMPIMPGGHTLRDIPFGDAFSATVDATRDRVAVTFDGINVPETANRAIPRQALVDGYAVSDLAIETLEGRRFTVTLVSPCTPAPVP